MSIVVDFTEILLRRGVSKKRIKKLIKNKRLTLDRTALAIVEEFDFLSKKGVSEVVLRALNQYKERLKGLTPEEKDSELRAILRDPKLLEQRVENHLILETTKEIKNQYKGERYRWLPSEADEPDPEHQLNYGKVFVVGDGEMPGERFGCRCGMEILVDETQLDI